MAGKLTDTEREMPLWMLMNPEIEELKRRTDALEKRAEALEKEIVLLVWAIAAAAAAVNNRRGCASDPATLRTLIPCSFTNACNWIAGSNKPPPRGRRGSTRART